MRLRSQALIEEKFCELSEGFSFEVLECQTCVQRNLSYLPFLSEPLDVAVNTPCLYSDYKDPRKHGIEPELVTLSQLISALGLPLNTFLSHAEDEIAEALLTALWEVIARDIHIKFRAIVEDFPNCNGKANEFILAWRFWTRRRTPIYGVVVVCYLV
jgi:hypothetical protein